MAIQQLDQSGQELFNVMVGKLNAMFRDLYAGTGSAGQALAPASVAATGAVSGASLTATGLTSTNTLQVDTGTKTAAATAGAATLNKSSGIVTSESLTTAAASDYTLTLTNSQIAAADMVFASVSLGTSTTGEPAVTSTQVSAGSVVIKIRNIAASAAFNGTIKIAYMVAKA